MSEIHGIIPPVITPFDEQQEIDEQRLRRHLNFLMDNGVHGVFVCGSTGEFVLLTPDERIDVMKIAADHVGGRIPVIGNIGYPGTTETIECGQKAMDTGVDAVFCIVPYDSYPTQAGMYAHFKQVAQHVNLPLLVYNIPPTVGVNMEPSTLAKLATEHLVMGTKESNRDPGQLAMDVILTGDKITILTGEDDFLFQALLIGAKGGILAFANLFPKVLVHLYEAVIQGEYANARAIQLSMIPLLQTIQKSSEPWPSGLKEAMNLSGRDIGNVRLPLLPVPKADSVKIKRALRDYDKTKIV